jgi:5,10-methylenetetrahydromethanopterin reductase
VDESDRLGLLFTGAPSVPEMVSLAQRAEDTGFESLWIAETRLTRDAITPAAAIAAATKRVRVGTGMVSVYTRDPVLLAITFLGLNELAPGRVVIGMSTGSPRVLAPQGLEFKKPLTRLREYCETIPRLVRGEAVTYHGHAVNLEDAKIEDVLSTDGNRLRADLPLYLGVTGPKAVQYAGTVADGVILNIFMSTDYVRERLKLLETGLHESGRELDDIEIGMVLLVSTDPEAAVARDAARPFIALYLGTFPHVAKETGAPAELIDKIEEALAGPGLEAAAKLVPDDLVDWLAAAGTPEDCRRRIDEYRHIGVGLPVLAPLEGGLRQVIDTFGPTTQA